MAKTSEDPGDHRGSDAPLSALDFMLNGNLCFGEDFDDGNDCDDEEFDEELLETVDGEVNRFLEMGHGSEKSETERSADSTHEPAYCP